MDNIDIQLNNIDDYKKYINIVFKYVKTIEYVVPKYLEANPKVLEYIENNYIKAKNVKKWMGTKGGGGNDLYKFHATPEFKKILLSFDNFFIINKEEISPKTYRCTLDMTSWGQSDIAFFDKDDEVISFITAHEGYLLVNKKYKDDFKEFLPDPRASYIFGLL